MKKYKVKISDKSYYEVIVDAESKEDAEQKVSDFEIDYTEGRKADMDREFKHDEKFWIESVEEMPSPDDCEHEFVFEENWKDKIEVDTCLRIPVVCSKCGFKAHETWTENINTNRDNGELI